MFSRFLVIEDGSGWNVLVVVLGGLFHGRWWRGLAVLGRWDDATEHPPVEDQRGRASLEAGVTSLTGPVAVARFTQRDVAVGVVLAERMFLAAADVFGPIAGVLLFAVQESSGTELLGGGAVPARPVADARLFVTEDSVLVVAWAHRDRRIGKCFVFAGTASPGIVAVLRQSESFAGEGQTVGAIDLLGLVIDTDPVTIAVSHIANHFRLDTARIRLGGLCHSRGDGYSQQGTDEELHR